MLKKIVLALLVAMAGLVAFDYAMPEVAARNGVALERWRAGLSTHTIEVNGYQVVYNAGGSGDPLLLVHGFGADKDNWTRVAADLTPHFRVIAVDLPGFGDSARLVDASYAIRDQVARLHDIVGALGLERFHMGGSSMGGFITLRYAATYPDQVQSLWLLAPAGVDGAEPSPLREAAEKEGKIGLIVERPEDFPSIMALTMEKPPFLPHSVKKVLGERAARDHDLHKRIFMEIHKSEPVNAAAPAITAPALIVWGTQDRALDVSGAPILNKLLPNSRLIIHDGIGHLPMIEQPGLSAREYLAFSGVEQ